MPAHRGRIAGPGGDLDRGRLPHVDRQGGHRPSSKRTSTAARWAVSPSAAARRTTGLANVELRQGALEYPPIQDGECDAALLLLVINLVGLGLGPWLVGVVSDVIYEAQLAAGASAVAAKAQGLRTALVIMVCVNLWSFAHYMLAARSLERDSVR